MHFELTPTAPCKYDIQVVVDIHGRGDYCFVEFAIRGDRSGIVIPEMQDDAVRSDNFEGTRFELFAGEKESSAYTEYIFSLDNGWNCFSFSDTNEGKSEASQETPDIVIMPAGMVFRHSAMISWDLLADRLCGMAAVLKHEDGSESIWALEGADAPEEIHNRINFIAEFKGESVVIPDETGEQRLQGLVKAMEGDDGTKGGCALPN